MGNSNSIAYVQRQMDNILRAFRDWCRTYIDDIFAVSDTLEEYVDRLHRLFAKLQEFNITLDPKKARLGFPTLTLLGKDIDLLGMTTTVEKVKAIRSLTFPRTCAKELKKYIEHCPTYLENRIRRHRPYGSLQPILSPPIPFHIITVDFILSLLLSDDGHNSAMSMTDKFTKLVGLIPGCNDWTSGDWAEAALFHWWTANWGIPSAIISDRDPKFV
ncbi:hypothetical protein PEBR_03224 [Penicillium brasilianum]|uniref:Reverse transcriptase domain-containing protein n=1 Tax=Penicillium brasilianum TaxID=104259 RepID=A0A1S9RYR8_PENBI|nr:hypothetical protein PEBR_03224 [Penicillium brasilianum]